MKKNKEELNAPEKKKNHKGLKIAIVIILILALAAGIFAVREYESQKEAQLQQEIAAEAEAAEKEAEAQAAEAEAEAEKEEEAEEEEEKIDPTDPESYTYEEIGAVYYGADGAKVVDLPNEQGEQIGTLYKDETITVLAKCVETGYYKIKINGGEYYVAEDGVSADYFDIPLPLPSEIVQPTAQKDILFIGNSITYHGPADFWWGNYWGMGATSADLDYVHLTVSAMGYSSYDVMSMRNWEMEDARNNDLDLLDSYVANYDYNIVVIFLGENAKGKEAHFGEDLVSMMEYIRAFNPDVKIVLMDNFWKYDGVIAEKKQAASEGGATYCSLSDLWGVSAYQLQAGEIINCGDVEYEVDSFVAGHPNNDGMAAISQKLVATLQSL